ncbi:unnamed protein product [Prorocentrum cordatum]|uniref:Uncharacterized protein n=1 Tax=Prorocentrum cordatum TaxID=2364126 RepID=A0ABN9XCP4_9DINO|nr:unnamed protein product [Polarella glacialis]
MLAAASVGRRRRELRHGRPLASRRLWERQRAVGKRRQRRAGGGRESPALPPRGVSAPPPPCPRAESRGERWEEEEKDEAESGGGGGGRGRRGGPTISLQLANLQAALADAAGRSPKSPPSSETEAARPEGGREAGSAEGGGDEGGTSRQALAPALAVNSRPALAQRQQSRRPQTGGRADPDTHTHTHTHTQHNKKTPGLVKRARASGPSVGGGPTRRSSKREQKQELSEVHANLIS